MLILDNDQNIPKHPGVSVILPPSNARAKKAKDLRLREQSISQCKQGKPFRPKTRFGVRQVQTF
jgi:hypothetical protein